jgi:2',3'-cyclic-nucleotide 2'-phosphodiesterase (5'-nucleotidase family)
LVIALAHTDISEDEALLEQGAVDMLLSGDDHMLRVDFDGDALFAESGEQGNWVTMIDVTLDEVERRGNMRFSWSPSFRIINTARVQPDAELEAAAQVYLDNLSDELNVEIGTTSTELDSRRATIRGKEAAIGNLIADAVRMATGADVSLANCGNIRANKIYPPGTMLTRRDILSELPFGNKTIMIELTGREIVSALENGLSMIEEGAGRFPHVSGLNVVYDPGKPAGERVVEIKYAGMALDLEATFTLATNNYIGSGGDGYDVFVDKKRLIDVNAGTLTASQVIEYIASQGSVAPVVEGRLRTVQ